LLYTFDTKRVAFCEFDVKRSPAGLTAIARGEPIDRGRHELHMEVKAITYHGLKVEPDGDGWLAEVIVDI
jgi:SHS2 domain-containing protein